MLRSGVGLVRASARVFLEASPAGLNPAEVGRALVGQPDVVEVHDLHVWEVTSGFAALSAHVIVATDADCHATRRALEGMLAERFDLHHTTLQVDHRPRELLELEVAPAARRTREG
jgi:cobalt-zinc-cadmium efflux system protein